ncbi:MAG: response regulator [Cyanobacteria bacterium CRU_2_1]|nr:response regulator [Cyanobacteria bacterium CRU_2_1]
MSTALVVEDSLTDREILSSCLQQAGLNVLTAESAEEATTKLKIYKFDVIILDVVLPDRSGFEVCREIKSNEETRQIPVVICSTKGGKLNQRWGMKHGANAYLEKPVDLEELMQTVRNLIRR